MMTGGGVKHIFRDVCNVCVDLWVCLEFFVKFFNAMFVALFARRHPHDHTEDSKADDILTQGGAQRIRQTLQTIRQRNRSVSAGQYKQIKEYDFYVYVMRVRDMAGSGR